MFCYQCEQTAKGTGCTKVGVCGKNEDIASLQDTLIFGLKGIAAYSYHARRLGGIDPEVDAFMHEALFATLTNTDFDLNRFLGLVLKAGETNLRAMALLDKTNTEKFGNPVPAKVPAGSVAGHGILVSGHDLLDMYELLRQTEGKGINVYTNAEMLPTHGYPRLKNFKHLVGNWGGSWTGQKREFDEFPGAMLVTSNCVLIPKESYKDRLFTCGVAGVEGVTHIQGEDFTPVIKKALELPPLPAKEAGFVTTGFHHSSVLAIADKIVSAVKAGKIKRFFVIGGCDAPGEGGNYYREFAKLVPQNCVILTLACGKYRFNDMDFGEIDGIPRLIDLGQCNNAYSAIRIASALAEAFNCSVNDLPLSLVLSWFEQKAVAILLTLLSLNIRGMRIGPKPPAFLTPNVFSLLQEKFDLKLIGDPQEDLQEILG